MAKYLRQFNDDKHTKEELLDYLVAFFQDKIIERALKKESVDSLADAISELKLGFDQLEIDYGLKEKSDKSTNHSR